ncbi:MAG: flagellar biosynthetic protein FliO [Gammaproteobacteria bacterium]|nr:flagellar biosynthetic protein FliO [Gammaproteobacteria bacterium]
MYKSILSVIVFLFLSFTVCIAEDKPGKGAIVSHDTAVTSTLSVNNYSQMMFGLLFVVGMIFAMAWLLRRMGRFQNAAGTGMKLLGGVSLGQRERALLIQVGETQILLGVAPGNVNTLHVFDKPVVAEPDLKSSGSFVEKFNAALKQKAGMS